MNVVIALAIVGPPVFAVCLRQVLQYLIERERWRSVERLARRHGVAVLVLLPELARVVTVAGGHRRLETSTAVRGKRPRR